MVFRAREQEQTDTTFLYNIRYKKLYTICSYVTALNDKANNKPAGALKNVTWPKSTVIYSIDTTKIFKNKYNYTKW